MQAIDTNHIKIGQLVWELCHFKDKWSELEWENRTFFTIFCGCCPLGNFCLELPSPSPMGGPSLKSQLEGPYSQFDSPESPLESPKSSFEGPMGQLEGHEDKLEGPKGQLAGP